MKKFFKISFALTIITVLVFSTFSMYASAASAIVGLSPNKKSFVIGETVTVSGTFNAGTSIYSFDGSITYDSSKMQYVSGGTNQGGYVQYVDSNLSGETSVSFSATFKAIAEGDHYFKFSGEGSPDGATKITAEAGVTVSITAPTPSTPSTTTPTVSSNANLKSLSVSGVTLSPAFSAGQTGYTATVANDVEKVTVSAAAADSGAKVSGAGSYPLDIGNNKISITVTAADGTKKYYSLSIKRQTAEETAAESAPTDQGGENPLSVTVDGKDYTVATDISTYKVPAGFTATRGIYGETEVAALTLSDMALYYLVDAEGNTLIARLCDDENFEKVMYLEIGGKTYIFMPTDKTLTSPSGFYETDLKLDIGEVKAFRYSNSVMDDIYIVHCWCEGKTGFYRYDSLENTIQRAPDFKMIKTSTAKPVQSGSLLGRFNALPTNGKIIIVAGILFAVLLIAFIVMIIVKLALRASLPRQLLQEDYYSDSDAANGFNLFEEAEEADAADEESPIPIAEEIEEESAEETDEEVEEETLKETLDAAPEESQDEF